jgi:hypothetical protein
VTTQATDWHRQLRLRAWRPAVGGGGAGGWGGGGGGAHHGTKVCATRAHSQLPQDSSDFCCRVVYHRISAAPLHYCCALANVANEGFCGACSRGSKLGPATAVSRARALALALAARRTSTKHLAPHPVLSCCWGGGSLGALAQDVPAVGALRLCSGAVFCPCFARVLGARLATFMMGVLLAFGSRGVGWGGHRHAADGVTFSSQAYGWRLG